MYPASSLFIAIGQLAIVILVLVSYPLQVHPCRNCLDKVFHAGHAHKPLPTSETQAVIAEGDETDDDPHASSEMSSTRHTAITAAIIASGFTIAYFVNDLRLVLAFVGSTGSTTISFILPGLFYWKVSWLTDHRHDTHSNNVLQLTRDDTSSRLLNKAALTLAVYGFAVLVFWYVKTTLLMILFLMHFALSLSFNIYEVATGGSGAAH
jgi:amino acid permease